MKFYSKTTGGFYAAAINGDNIPADAVEISEAAYAALMEGQAIGKRIVSGENGFPVLTDPAPPTQEEVIKQYEAELDAHMDAVAKAHRYDNRFTFALRAGYEGPYQDEGVAFAQWMDECNVKSFALLNDVLAGKADLPTVDAFIAGLPDFVKS